MHDAAHPILTSIVAAMSLGVLLMALARRLALPAIVLLLAGGMALGPMGIGVVQPDSLGEGLRVLISLLVGIILFEGGLTLDVSGYRAASRVILRLLTVGVLTTWVGAALTIWLLADQSVSYSIIAASLLIVTGPTVIGPLLKRVRVNETLHNVLQWEGVLIDPIGVFIALLCFEALALHRGGRALVDLASRVGSGLLVGLVGGWLIYQALRRRFIPEDMVGIGTLAGAVLVFGVTETIVPEAGLLSMAVAGFVVGVKRPVDLLIIRQFKGEITEMSIAMVFILLSARLELEQFVVFGWRGALIVAAIMFVVRPLNVFVSTRGLGVGWRERAFLSWIAPRGIVAASMASLFAINFERLGAPNPRFVESLTYGVIVGTIVIQGLTAGLLARQLGVLRTTPKGWLIVGAHRFGREIARFLAANDAGPVLLVDNNRAHVRRASQEGLTALLADARDVQLIERRPETPAIGRMIALTSNEDFNSVLCRRWSEYFGPSQVYRWSSRTSDVDDEPGNPVWTDLPNPSIISSELESGEGRLILATGAGAGWGRPRRRLVSIDPDGARLVREAPVVSRSDESPPSLLFERKGDELSRSVRDDLVFDMEADAPERLLPDLVTRVADVVALPDPGAITSELIEREAALSSALGHGVAVPHAYVAGIDERVCAVARIRDGADWHAPDEQPVSLVFLLLGPPTDHDHHLAILADIARVATSDATLENLLAVDREDLLAALTSPTAS